MFGTMCIVYCDVIPLNSISNSLRNSARNHNWFINDNRESVFMQPQKSVRDLF